MTFRRFGCHGESNSSAVDGDGFFFQAEDGIRDDLVTGVQTCALPIFRSLRIYYGGKHDRSAMDRLYARFVQPNDLVFDVGSHVGDRIAAFRRLGCRVVACEPNPPLVKTLRLIYGRDAGVTTETGAGVSA